MKASALKYYMVTLLLAAALTSCRKVIDLKLRDNTGKLVIEANITNKRGPQYQVEPECAFTGTNTYPRFSGATVNVTDNAGNTFPFVEGPAGTYAINLLTGKAGRTYTMNVKADGLSYTANSQMPQEVALDSITEKADAFDKANNHRQITVHFKDPPGVPNLYRFILTVNNVQVNRIFAFNDDFFDGRNVSLDLFQSDVDIVPGDKVTVEMQCLDKPVYTYWFTLMQQSNGPGGGVSPSNPPTNITPAVLGYFSAHTTQAQVLDVR